MSKEVNIYEFYFDILDGIRESGKINMFEAPRQLRELFGLDKKESYKVFEEWMNK